MKLYNPGNYFSKKQLNQVLALLDRDYVPSILVICENKSGIIKLFQYIHKGDALSEILSPSVWLGKREGIYFIKNDTVVVYVFSENDDGDDKHSKQLYSLHALIHEVRHRWQDQTCFIGDEEEDCDNFATSFLNGNSKKIAKIMKWKREWEISEE